MDLKTLLEPPEVWDAAEEQIELWQEERSRERRMQWKLYWKR